MYEPSGAMMERTRSRTVQSVSIRSESSSESRAPSFDAEAEERVGGIAFIEDVAKASTELSNSSKASASSFSKADGEGVGDLFLRFRCLEVALGMLRSGCRRCCGGARHRRLSR